MNYIFVYHPLVQKRDLANLDEITKTHIRSFIWIKLAMAPELYSFPLRISLQGHRKARVGDHILLFRIEKRAVLILAIVPYSAIR